MPLLADMKLVRMPRGLEFGERQRKREIPDLKRPQHLFPEIGPFSFYLCLHVLCFATAQWLRPGYVSPLLIGLLTDPEILFFIFFIYRLSSAARHPEPF